MEYRHPGYLFLHYTAEQRTLSLSVSLSNSSLCSEPQNQALLPITAKRSLAPFVSDHPSLTYQSTLTARPSQAKVLTGRRRLALRASRRLPVC